MSYIEFYATARVMKKTETQIPLISIKCHGTTGVIENGELTVRFHSVEFYAFCIFRIPCHQWFDGISRTY